MKTILLIFAWFYGFLLVAILLGQWSIWLFNRRTPDMQDEEAERWRRAFEGTDFEWERDDD